MFNNTQDVPNVRVSVILSFRKKIKDQMNCVKSDRIKDILRKDHTDKDREVKKRVRADKRKMFEEMAKKAEEAAKKNEMGTVYKITNTICGKKHKKSAGVRTKDGKLLTQEDEVRGRWEEHFNEVLNIPCDIPVDESVEDELQAEKDYLENINLKPPTREVRRNLKRMQNDKAPGIDGMTAEMWKADIGLSVTELHSLLKIRDSEIVPSEWKKSLISITAKKGNLTICDNSRGVSFLPTASKLLGRILIDRLVTAVDEKLRLEQAGFRKGRGTIEQIYILRNIIEQSVEWQGSRYVNFVDFQKAFDSLARERIWQILRRYGIPEKFVCITRNWYDNSESAVIYEGSILDWFKVTTGVKLGCVMSGFIFIIVLDWVMRRTVEEERNGIRWDFSTALEDLIFADDIALISSTWSQMQRKTSRLERNAVYVGLKMSVKKTKVMRINARRQESIKISGSEIEDTDEFTYLGSTMTKDGGAEADIRKRLSKARNSFNILGKVLKSESYSRKTKLRLLQSNAIPLLLYGAELWRMTSTDELRLDRFHRVCLKKIMKIRWPIKISNEELYRLTSTKPVSETIRER